MAAITVLKLTQHPSKNSYGTNGDTHRAIFYAETDEPLPAAYVEQLASELVGGSLPSTNPDGSFVNEVPNPGDRLFWSADQGLVPDTYTLGTAGVTEFLADGSVTGAKYYDQGAVALDFETVVLDCPTHYQISVTYRAPTAGQNEQPQQVVQLLSGRNGVDAPQPIPPANPTSDAEYWIEQRPYEAPTTKAYFFNPVSGNVETTLQKMEMPNHEGYPPLSISLMRDVQVIAWNDTTLGGAAGLNATWANTTNSAQITLGGRVVPKYCAHYEVTKTGRPMTRNNSKYFRIEARIVLFEEPPFIERVAIGSYYIPAGNTDYVVPYDRDGLPIMRVPLTATGDWANVDGTDTAVQTYCRQKPVDYSYWEQYTYGP